MNYLTLENVSKSYGEKLLFSNIQLYINKGDKVALIAKNGTGKTSLLDIIAGMEQPEGVNARVLMAKDIKVGVLSQDPQLDNDQSVFEEVLMVNNPKIKAVKMHLEAMNHPDDPVKLQEANTLMDELKAWNQEASVREILSKLKIERLNDRVGTLSGGQKKRLALAKLLIDEPDFLILDEPTNHLDLDMIEWLEVYLQQQNLTLLMVTHDRYFLECICDQILELDQGRITKYTGNYSEYLEKKALATENEATEMDKVKKLYSKELDWVRRQPKARTTKAKSRVDKFEEIKEKAFSKKDDDEFSIDIKAKRQGTKILEAHQIGKAYGDLVLIEKFTYKFRPGERVGIVGPNGSGKSTFLDILTDRLSPDTGKLVIGDNTVFGYYTQDGIDLSEDKRVIDVVTDIAEYIPLEKGKSLSAAALLERFLFPRSQQQVFVSKMSGGEKRRLYLLTVLIQNPNFLILDEPTNDLDIMTLNVLEDYLLQFPGCLIIVSHDRYFLDKLTEHLFILEGNGKVRDYNGNYSQYRAWQKEQIKPTVQKKANEALSTKPNEVLGNKERKELHNIEKEIEKLEKRKNEIMETFNELDIDAGKLESLSQELGNVQTLLEEKEMRWLELEEMKTVSDG